MTTDKRLDLRAVWLLVATFCVAIASLIYELIAATLSSYLIGDSIRQFSFVIGTFLFSMGLGAWVSRFVTKALPAFLWVQISIGLTGGALAPLIYFSYAYLGQIEALLYGTLGLIGILSGMEIPLIARVLKEIGATAFRFENVLSVDYIGALFASLAFPLFIIPNLSLMSASIAFGCLNLAIAGGSIWVFRHKLSGRFWVPWGLSFAVSLAALVASERMISVVDAALFEDDIIIQETTSYQHIAITRFRDRTRLFLDHSIQFDTLDEHRYHEALVHPAMASVSRRTHVLVLGGGDGMAVREALKYQDVATVTLVDLDPRVTELFRDHDELRELNARSLADPRVSIINEDAWQFAKDDARVFDVIIVDLPDPKSISLSKLYSVEFYGLLLERLSPRGSLVTQASSPMFARNAFWSVVATLEAARNPAGNMPLSVQPYHAYVPSFGDWGFVMAHPTQPTMSAFVLPDELAFLTDETWSQAQVFAKDIARTEAMVNSIKTHPLVGYYQDGWDYWFR